MGTIVGIDLGTSTSEIAYIKDGKPHLIPNTLGEYVTPSVVHIAQNGEIIVGSIAKEKLILEPDCTFMEVKRLIGTGAKLTAHGKTYTPEEISSFILKYLVQCAENHLNEKIENAVITVPAYFTNEQRIATINAGKLAGLTVERIINEPTAASLDYGISHLDECKNILVYDLGGGTLDVTLLELFEGVIEVKASYGDTSLGGKDFDEVIMNFVIEKYKNEHKINLENDPRAMMRLKKEAENCKINLSTQLSYSMELPFFTSKDNEPIALSETITRKDFEKLIKEKVYGTSTQVKRVIYDGGFKKEDIDLILLVGGSTKIPLVSQFIYEELGQSPQKLIDPDLGVVRGAAIQSGIIQDSLSDNSLVITDVCPYTLSTAVLDYTAFGMPIEVCDVLIKRNVTIPVTKERDYYTSSDYQTKVRIRAYQGESKNPELNKLLNEFTLSDIPAAPVGEETISISFSYDLNGILVVTGKVVSTGESTSIEINTDNLCEEEVDYSKWNQAKLSSKYRSIIKRGEKLISSGMDETFIIEDLIKSLKIGLVTAKDKAYLDEIKNKILDAIYILEEGNDD